MMNEAIGLRHPKLSECLTQATGSCHDQIPCPIIPRTSLHCRHFRASAGCQRPHLRVRVAWWHRVHCGFLRDPGPLHYPFSVLQALRNAWQPQRAKELSTRRAITRLIGVVLMSVVWLLTGASRGLGRAFTDS